MIKVRPATHEDFDWLLVQLRAFNTFFNSRHQLYGEEQYIVSAFTTLMKDHLVLIAESDEHGQMGFIAGLVSPHFFNPNIKSLNELFWWVDEKHRHSRAGLMLLNAYTEWGRKNAQWITMTLEHDSPVADRTLLKRGYLLKERNFLLECEQEAS
jgi:hypothetical protein